MDTSSDTPFIDAVGAKLGMTGKSHRIGADMTCFFFGGPWDGEAFTAPAQDVIYPGGDTAAGRYEIGHRSENGVAVFAAYDWVEGPTLIVPGS